ncbi:hypothetical protein ES703_86711 [subsurface metagenome]
MVLDPLREDAERLRTVLGGRRGPMFHPVVRDMRPYQTRWIYLIVGPGDAIYDWDWGAEGLVITRCRVSLAKHPGSRARLFQITEVGAPW